MKQYLNLVEDVMENGKDKGDRTGTGTRSVIGRQMRFNLQDGFPIVTAKKTNFNAVVAELLWFIEGSTNSQRLNELGAKIWDEWSTETGELGPVYGKQWRQWNSPDLPAAKERLDQLQSIVEEALGQHPLDISMESLSLAKTLIDRIRNADLDQTTDQLKEVIAQLQEKPNSRRIILNAWNPADLPSEDYSPIENAAMGKAALPPCHTLCQFFTEELTTDERIDYAEKLGHSVTTTKEAIYQLEFLGIPTRKLHCQMYQR